MKEESKYVLIEFGELCVALDPSQTGPGQLSITGEHKIVMWYANNLDIWS